MTGNDWDPKPGDKAFIWTDTPVVIVRKTETPDVYIVRYAERDNFGERATFAADRLELTPRAER